MIWWVIHGMTDMKKSGFTEEQIIGFIRHAEASMPVKLASAQARAQH